MVMDSFRNVEVEKCVWQQSKEMGTEIQNTNKKKTIILQVKSE